MLNRPLDTVEKGTTSFLLRGSSGDGRFVRRFRYLHPRRPRAASIGAPGMATLLDDRWDRWVGPRSVGAALGTGRTRIDRVEALRRSFEANRIPVGSEGVEGVGHAGARVQDRVRASFREVVASPATGRREG